MKAFFLLALVFTSSFVSFAAESRPEAKVQAGKLSTVRLLAVARITGKEVPDGMRFLFLVTPTSGTTGQFTIKETRDFQVAGESYQQKTQLELGKKFEPGTNIDSAEGFFAKQPGMRRLAPDDIRGATVLTIAIGGAQLTAGTKIEVTLHVGFGKDVEPFTFQAMVRDPSSGAPRK